MFGNKQTKEKISLEQRRQLHQSLDLAIDSKNSHMILICSAKTTKKGLKDVKTITSIHGLRPFDVINITSSVLSEAIKN